MPDALAQTPIEASFFLKIKYFIQDIRELIEFDPEERRLIALKHAQEEQMDIERDLALGIPVALERYARVETKLQNAEDLIGQPDRVREFIEDIRLVTEVNEVRKCVSDFWVLRDMGSESTIYLKESLASNIDERCNALKATHKYCNEPIDSLELSEAINPYEKLQEICPRLEGVSSIVAYERLFQ